MARDIKHLRSMMTRIANAIDEAQSEVPEKMRRFTNYMHDIHDVTYMYEQRGLVIPAWIAREMERCDDRLRQLLEDLHADAGAFEQVRREMTERGGNRWDHTRFLPKGTKNEAGNE
jgi:hypothetical protein